MVELPHLGISKFCGFALASPLRHSCIFELRLRFLASSYSIYHFFTVHPHIPHAKRRLRGGGCEPTADLRGRVQPRQDGLSDCPMPSHVGEGMGELALPAHLDAGGNGRNDAAGRRLRTRREERRSVGHTDTAAANNGPALRSLASSILLASDASLPERQFSPLKASHRSIDLTRSHTLRPSSVRHRPYMQLNGLFVRVPLHLGRRIEPAAGREIHYLVYALEGKRSLSGWPAVSERTGTSWPSPSFAAVRRVWSRQIAIA